MARYNATTSIKYKGRRRIPGGAPFEVDPKHVDKLGALITPAGKADQGKGKADDQGKAGDQGKADDQGKGKAPELVNVNTATAEEIAKAAKGIGPKTAKDLVEHRDGGNTFATLDDLEKVGGISKATIDENRDVLTV